MTVASQSPKFCPIPLTWHLWKTRELDLGYYVCFPLWKCSICFRALLICYYCNFYVPGYIFPYAFHSFLLPQQWSKFTPVCFDTTGDSKGNSYSKGMRNFLYTSCISHSVLQFQEKEGFRDKIQSVNQQQLIFCVGVYCLSLHLLPMTTNSIHCAGPYLFRYSLVLHQDTKSILENGLQLPPPSLGSH